METTWGLVEKRPQGSISEFAVGTAKECPLVTRLSSVLLFERLRATENAGGQQHERPEELENAVDRDAEEPFTWDCSECEEGTMGRVEEVIDAWFDAGSMPFAQHHYPFENRQLIDEQSQFPADFIAEAVDQTRGWFYSMLAISTMLFGDEQSESPDAAPHAMTMNTKG